MPFDKNKILADIQAILNKSGSPAPVAPSRNGKNNRRGRSTTPAPAITAPNIANSSKKAKVEVGTKKAADPVDPFFSLTQNPQNGSLSDRRTALSIGGTPTHPGDFAEFQTPAGDHIISTSTVAHNNAGYIVVSNVDHDMFRSFRDWTTRLASTFPVRGGGGLAQVGDSYDRLLHQCSVETEEAHTVAVLELMTPVLTAVPTARQGTGRSQILPVYSYFPLDEAVDGPISPCVISYVSRLTANVVQTGNAVGAVRCFAHHSVDIALHQQMIYRILAQKLGASLAKDLAVIPSILSHTISLRSPKNYEVIFRVVIGRGMAARALIALYGNSDVETLMRFPGEIYTADFNFLLVWNAETLNALPFDSRLTAPSFSLPADTHVYSWRVPSLLDQTFSAAMLSLIWVLEGGSASSSASSSSQEDSVDVVHTCRRFVARENSLLIFTSSPLPNGVLKRMTTLFKAASLTALQTISSDGHRTLLLKTLHDNRSKEWHALWQPALPHNIASRASGSSAIADGLTLDSQITGLSSSISRLVEELEIANSRIALQSRTISDLHTHQATLHDELSRLKGESSTHLSKIRKLQQAETQFLQMLKSLADRLASLEGASPRSLGASVSQNEEGSAVGEEQEDDEEGGDDEVDLDDDEDLDDEVDGGDEEDLEAEEEMEESEVPSAFPVLLPSPALPPPLVNSTQLSRLSANVGLLDVGSPARSLVLDAEGDDQLAGGGPKASARGSAVAVLSYASQLAPAHPEWVRNRPLFVPFNTIGTRLPRVAPLNCEDKLLCAGMAPAATRAGVPLIRITVLLPRVQWGATLLLPAVWKPPANGQSAASGLLQQGTISLHRMLPIPAVAHAAQAGTEATYWVTTMLTNWITLETASDVTGLEQDDHLLKMGGLYYSLRTLAKFERHLPISLTTFGLTELGGRLGELQQAVLALNTALSKLTILLAGGIGLSFSHCSVSAAIILLQSFSTGGPLLKGTILELPCSVTLTVRTPPRAVQDYGQFNQLHAFALWRKMANSRAEGAVFLGPSTGKPSGPHTVKLTKPFKEEFLCQFEPPPTELQAMSQWEEFKTVLMPGKTALPTTFSDNWLEHNLRRHSWLGRVWRTKEKDSIFTLSPIRGPMTLNELTDLVDHAQISLEANSSKAAPFFFPKVSTLEQEKIFSAVSLVCDKVREGLAFNLKDLHEADPLGLKFPSTISL